MSKSFRDKETEKVFHRQRSKKLAHDVQQRALRKLRMLNRSGSMHGLRVPPSNHLEKLSGNREGQHSIRINDQGRIWVGWREGDLYEVEIIDYH